MCRGLPQELSPLSWEVFLLASLPSLLPCQLEPHDPSGETGLAKQKGIWGLIPGLWGPGMLGSLGAWAIWNRSSRHALWPGPGMEAAGKAAAGLENFDLSDHPPQRQIKHPHCMGKLRLRASL